MILKYEKILSRFFDLTQNDRKDFMVMFLKVYLLSYRSFACEIAIGIAALSSCHSSRSALAISIAFFFNFSGKFLKASG